jgi:hypothetical protein
MTRILKESGGIMSFKENLLQKIKIDRTANKVIATIGPPDTRRKVDKNLMRSLLEMSPYTYKRKRDLDLFLQDIDTDKKKILVLDNDLAIYHTTVEDVGLRKSPTVKEMINIRNIIKILNDTDVVISKKEESVRTIQKACIDRLDFSFSESDLEEMVQNGIASLEREYADGVLEAIDLFAEMLGFGPPPKPLRISHHKITGGSIQKKRGEIVFGPMVIYSMISNTIKWIDKQISSFDREKIEFVHQVAAGKEDASAEGPNVFHLFKKLVDKGDVFSG